MVEVVRIRSFNDRFQLRLLGRQRVEVGIRFRVGRVNFIQTRLCRFDLPECFLHNLADCLAGVEYWLLLEIADIDTRHRKRLTFDLSVAPRHDLQQSGFTRTV